MSGATRKEAEEPTPLARSPAAALDYQEITGDLFSASCDALAHCVSADFAMGAGIAREFKARFGGVEELCRQCVDVGGVGVLVRGSRYIFYLVTKTRARDKPTYATMEASLRALQRMCESMNVEELAIPLLGCGLDGLDWARVSALVKKAFAFTGMRVRVYRLPEGGQGGRTQQEAGRE